MTTNVLFIGDPHFQVTNIVKIDKFMEKIINLATEKQTRYYYNCWRSFTYT